MFPNYFQIVAKTIIDLFLNKGYFCYYTLYTYTDKSICSLRSLSGRT